MRIGCFFKCLNEYLVGYSFIGLFEFWVDFYLIRDKNIYKESMDY